MKSFTEMLSMKELAAELPNKSTTTQEQDDKLVGISTAECLNSLLANEFALFTKTLKYHWNVKGPRFYSVHEFTEEQYKTLLNIIDSMAERIQKIGGVPIGTLTEFQRKNDLTEEPGNNPETSAMISDLLQGHRIVQNDIREILKRDSRFISDPGTEDFLTGLLKEHEEMSWKLKSKLR